MVSPDFSGVILAGGKSSRFGSNKALALVGDRPLIEYPARVIESVFQKRLLVTNTPESYKFIQWPASRDIFPGQGPLAGIHAALLNLPGQAVFITACDMPDLDPRLIRQLCRELGNFDAVIPQTARGPEPLHAVYSQNCLGHIEGCLKRGERKVGQILSGLRLRKFSEDEILAVSGSLDSFRNINRPGDL